MCVWVGGLHGLKCSQKKLDTQLQPLSDEVGVDKIAAGVCSIVSKTLELFTCVFDTFCRAQTCRAL